MAAFRRMSVVPGLAARGWSSPWVTTTRAASSKGIPDEALPMELAMPDADEEAQAERAALEARIEQQRDVSRLHPHHRRLVNGEVPHPEPKAWFHTTVKYRQRMLARYGAKATGINPGIHWPTREELMEKVEYERVENPFTLQEMVMAAQDKRREVEEYRKRRAVEVERNMAKLEQWKKDLVMRQRKKEEEARKAQEKKERLMEEVRRHFGYKVDVKDLRFKELLEKKEKEEKKAAKEAKKKEQHAKMLAQLERVQEQMGES